MPEVRRTLTTRSSAGPKKKGLFSKIKNVFKGGKSNSNNSDGDSLKLSRTTSLSLTRTKTRGSSYHRFSTTIFGPTTSDKEESERERKEQELEDRRAKCVAIKMAKHDPIEVQNLLVDCEFCNPPSDFGREIPIVTPQFTSDNVVTPGPDNPIVDPDDEITWNVGLNEWYKIRNWWQSPTAYQVERHHLDPSCSPDRFYAIYDKMIYHTRPLKQPLNLEDTVKIVKAGWIGEGSWPTEDLWYSSGDEEEKKNNDEVSQPQSSAPDQDHQVSTPAPSTMETSELPVPLQSIPGAEKDTTEQDAKEPINGTPLKPSISESGHVQFHEDPHPRHPKNITPERKMPSLQRMQSGMSIRPTVSQQSSMVFVTDSD